MFCFYYIKTEQEEDKNPITALTPTVMPWAHASRVLGHSLPVIFDAPEVEYLGKPPIKHILIFYFNTYLKGFYALASVVN